MADCTTLERMVWTMNKRILGFGVGLALAFLVCAKFMIKKNTLAPTLTDQVLVVGTSDDYPPYTFSENGKVVGFDIDLAREIARRMRCEMELKVMSFDILLLELQRGTIQVIAAGLTPTPERALKVFFSSPYIKGDPLLAVTRATDPVISTLADMQGKTVVVNEGYTADFYMSAQPGLVLEKRETVAEALLALERDKADVYVVAQSAFQPFLKTKGQSMFKSHPLADVSEKYALAISKKYPELFEKIESALVELLEDGTVEDLKKKWGLV
jgi:ABC-type amino acid transport substrate-binding protein